MNDDELETWAAAYRAARRPAPQTRRAVEDIVLRASSTRSSRMRPPAPRRRALPWAVCSAGIVAALLVGLLLGILETRRLDRASPGDPSLAPDLNMPAPPQRRLATPGLAPSVAPDAPIPVGAEETTPPHIPARSLAAPRTTTSTAPPEVDSMRLLREAQRRLADDAQGALELLHLHGATFPQSALALEREALIVLALCLSPTHRHEGRRARDAFLRQHGSSAYAARIRNACETLEVR